MLSYESLQNILLKMVQENWPAEDEFTLASWIFSGYGEMAPEPHQRTCDLFSVYAMNLLNSGLRGPQMKPFGQMIAEAIETRFLVDNAVQSFEVSDLAEACAQILRVGGMRLKGAGNDEYLEALDDFAKGETSSDASSVIFKLLDSIVQFSRLLREKYEGRAEIYHQSFRVLNAGTGNALYESINGKLEEIKQLPLVGPATGPNFLKDSQTRSLIGQVDAWRDFGIIPYFVKPDIHVSRMMLWLTRPAVRGEISLKTLHTLEVNEVFRFYKNLIPAEPTQYPSFPKSGESEWQCTWDIFAWGEAEGQPPVRFDRLLYLAGSGRFRDGQKMKQSQFDRYSAVLGNI